MPFSKALELAVEKLQRTRHRTSVFELAIIGLQSM